MTFSESNEGQFMLALLSEFGLTPAAWRELDPRDATFLLNGYRHRLEKEQRRRRDEQARMKTRRR